MKIKNKIIYHLKGRFVPKFISNYLLLSLWNEKKIRKERESILDDLTRSGRPIRVLFIASSLPMWRGQGLFDLLNKDTRFEPKIIICPLKRFNEDEAKKYSEDIYIYLKKIGIDAVLGNDPNFNIQKFLAEFNPDIIFPSQPYHGILGNQLDFEFNKNRIYCYIPYALLTVKNDFAYNDELNNLCWRYYLPSILHYNTAKKKMANKASNVKIVGEIDYDKFQKSTEDPWKKIPDGKKRKKIIWAPHFSISPSDALHRSSFLWLYDVMPNIANKYRDTIQIAFKPHPNLYSVLCKLEGWGRDKANQYYSKWAEMYNTQLEEGSFIDLFSHSDAMIHDSGSFTGEYMFVNKPVMFTTKNLQFVRNWADDFGLKCLDLHYIGKNDDDIANFIEDVVLGGNDRMKLARGEFFKRYLIPPNERSVAENIYNDLLVSLGFTDE